MADLAGLGQRVRTARLAACLRQEDVAKRVGMTRSSIANIEADRQGNIPVATLVRLAEALAVSASALLGEAEMPSLPDHELILIVDVQRQRGWHLVWKCRRADCDAKGDLTTPRREDAMGVFTLVNDGHRKIAREPGVQPTEEQRAHE
jgi:transcriptional regulator with XRE-family HTH domain